MDFIPKNAPRSLHGANIAAADVLLDFIRTCIKLDGGTIRALVHILVDILHRVQTLARLNVDVGLVLPAQIGVVWHDPFIPDLHSGGSVNGDARSIGSAPVDRIAVMLEDGCIGEGFG